MPDVLTSSVLLAPNCIVFDEVTIAPAPIAVEFSIKTPLTVSANAPIKVLLFPPIVGETPEVFN